VFVGASDAVLDGGGWVDFAFSGSASDVVVQGLHIRDYNTPAHFGSIYVSGSGWLVEGNDVHGSAWAGIAVRDDEWTRSDPNDVPRNNVVRNNIVHDNDQLGLTVRGTIGTVIEGNEIAYNNRYGYNDWGFEAGGTKFWDTEGLIVRNNYSHDNFGPGLWDDFNNNNILYEGNLIEDNMGPGIFHEIGYAATIRNNTIRRNGDPSGDPWLWGAGIIIAASQNTNVYGNVLDDNSNGIALIQQNRGWGDRGEWIVQNNNIYNNVINGGMSGAVQDTGDNSIFYNNNNFYDNTYTGGSNWAWNNDNDGMSWSAWQSTGNDTNGTYSP
jgi:parallel beta-helix repeat protein